MVNFILSSAVKHVRGTYYHVMNVQQTEIQVSGQALYPLTCREPIESKTIYCAGSIYCFSQAHGMMMQAFSLLCTMT